MQQPQRHRPICRAVHYNGRKSRQEATNLGMCGRLLLPPLCLGYLSLKIFGVPICNHPPRYVDDDDDRDDDRDDDDDNDDDDD